LFENILPSTITRCVDSYVQLQLDATPTITTIFDLWMNKDQQDTFAFLINFLSADWKLHCVTIILFKTNVTMGMGLARQLKAMLEKVGVTSKVL